LKSPRSHSAAATPAAILIKADEGKRIAALVRAVAAGINWIDTRAALRQGAPPRNRSGRHFAALDPQPHISTKVRIERDDTKDLRGAIERSLEQSLKRLQIDRVTLFQLPTSSARRWATGRR